MISQPSQSHRSWFGARAERVYFIENLSLLLSSGMSIIPALESIKQDLRSQKMYRIVDTLQQSIANGMVLADALEQSGLFKENALTLIRVGEASGRLSENLKMVAEQDAKDRTLASKIKSAMIYPAIIFTLILILGIGISWFILPKMATVFSDLNIPLPPVTKMVIAVGFFLQDYGIIAVPLALVILVAIVYFVFFYKKTKFIGQALLLRTPGFSRLLREAELSQWGITFGELLHAGVPLDQALPSIIRTTRLVHYRKFYEHIEQAITSGNSFEKAFSSYTQASHLVPTPILQMIASAEQAGSLSETFIKIGEIYAEKLDTTTKNFSVLVEPVLLIVVWFGVLIIALAVVLPIYGLIGGLTAL